MPSAKRRKTLHARRCEAKACRKAEPEQTQTRREKKALLERNTTLDVRRYLCEKAAEVAARPCHDIFCDFAQWASLKIDLNTLVYDWETKKQREEERLVVAEEKRLLALAAEAEDEESEDAGPLGLPEHGVDEGDEEDADEEQSVDLGRQVAPARNKNDAATAPGTGGRGSVAAKKRKLSRSFSLTRSRLRLGGERGADSPPSESCANKAASKIVKIYQDLTPNLAHSGGIVWETSYLLACYLLHRFSSEKKNTFHTLAHPTILELGSGCGFLGVALAHHFPHAQVVVTEYGPAMANLQKNVEEANRRDKLRLVDRVALAACSGDAGSDLDLENGLLAEYDTRIAKAMENAVRQAARAVKNGRKTEAAHTDVDRPLPPDDGTNMDEPNTATSAGEERAIAHRYTPNVVARELDWLTGALRLRSCDHAPTGEPAAGEDAQGVEDKAAKDAGRQKSEGAAEGAEVGDHAAGDGESLSRSSRSSDSNSSREHGSSEEDDDLESDEGVSPKRDRGARPKPRSPREHRRQLLADNSSSDGSGGSQSTSGPSSSSSRRSGGGGGSGTSAGPLLLRPGLDFAERVESYQHVQPAARDTPTGVDTTTTQSKRRPILFGSLFAGELRKTDPDIRKFSTTSRFATFDYIVATDVIFDQNLVVPLLQTMWRHSHSGTSIFLCVQVRCRAAHDLFFSADVMARFFQRVEKLSFGKMVKTKVAVPGDLELEPRKGEKEAATPFLSLLQRCWVEEECLLFKISRPVGRNGGD